MTSSSPPPPPPNTSKTSNTYFYKILDSPPPSPLPGTLPATALDAQDGFIHLSTAPQIPLTATLFFASCTKLWLLKVRVADLDGEIKFVENLPECPHLYNSVKGLGRGCVEEVIFVERRKKEEKWGDVMGLLKNKLES